MTQDIWNIIKDMGGLLASIATFLTIFFIYKQRKDSFRPKLLIDFRNNFGILGSSYVEWGDSEGKHPYFSLINTGNGIAENIKYSVKYDANAMFEYVKKIKGDVLKVFEIRPTFYYAQFNNSEGLGINLPLNITGERSALIDLKTLPDASIEIPFDNSYLLFLSLIEKILSIKGEPYLPLLDFPKLTYTISYQNSEGNNYQSKYQLFVHRLGPARFEFIFKKI